MADNYLSGKDAYVKLGSAAYSFAKWTADIRTGAPKVNNFTSGGFDANVQGFTGATINLTGPYNEGNMPLTGGQTYVFHLGFITGAPGVELQITARVTSIKPTADAEGTVTLDVTAESTGSFTASVL